MYWTLKTKNKIKCFKNKIDVNVFERFLGNTIA